MTLPLEMFTVIGPICPALYANPTGKGMLVTGAAPDPDNTTEVVCLNNSGSERQWIATARTIDVKRHHIYYYRSIMDDDDEIYYLLYDDEMRRTRSMNSAVALDHK
jgi:hypothetical protein